MLIALLSTIVILAPSGAICYVMLVSCLIYSSPLREARRRILGEEDEDMKTLLGSTIGKKKFCKEHWSV